MDRFGAVTGHRPGSAAITAEYEGVSASWEARVEAFPAVRMELGGELDEARTGDVLSFVPRFFDDASQEVTDIPVTWGCFFQSVDGVRQPGAVALVLVEERRFLAEESGRYAVVASAGPLNARRTVEVSR